VSAVQIELPEAVIDVIAQRAAAILEEHDGGFLDIDGAREFLGGCSRKRIYNLVERGDLPTTRSAAGSCSTRSSCASGWRPRSEQRASACVRV
jgi:hypothetical protein